MFPFFAPSPFALLAVVWWLHGVEVQALQVESWRRVRRP